MTWLSLGPAPWLVLLVLAFALLARRASGEPVGEARLRCHDCGREVERVTALPPRWVGVCRDCE